MTDPMYCPLCEKAIEDNRYGIFIARSAVFNVEILLCVSCVRTIAMQKCEVRLQWPDHLIQDLPVANPRCNAVLHAGSLQNQCRHVMGHVGKHETTAGVEFGIPVVPPFEPPTGTLYCGKWIEGPEYRLRCKLKPNHEGECGSYLTDKV